MKYTSFHRLASPTGRFFLLLLIAALPWLARDFFQLPALAFDHFTDAVFYPAYATNFSELVLRHGFIYYAMRFGVIFPDALFSWFFTAPEGWLVLRAALQSGLLILVYLFFEKRGGWAAGLLAVLFWWASPVTLRSLCTTYLDSLAMPFFVAGTLLLAWPGARVWMALLAGVLWALAASAHLYLLILMPVMVPFIMGNRWREWKETAFTFAWSCVGALVVWSIAYAYYRGVWGIVDMWAPTKELMSGMAAGETELWKSPLLEALGRVPAWFAPIALLGGTACFLRRDAPALWGAWIALGGAAAFFWLGDLIGGAYALSMPFYFSFLYPAVFLAAATGMSEALLRMTTCKKPQKVPSYLAYTTVFLLVGAFYVGSSTAMTRIMTGSIAWITILLIALVCIAVPFVVLPRRIIRWKMFIFLLALCATQSLILATPFFAQYLAKYKRLHRDELWQPELSAQLSRIMPPAALDGRPIRFWYDDSEPGLLRMVQASQLHRFSLLRDQSGEPLAFPVSDNQDLLSLEESGVGIIMILDEKREPVEAASAALRSKFSEWTATREGELKHRGKKIYFAMLERRTPDEKSLASSVPLQWDANPPAVLVSLESGGALLRSSSRKWMFEASAALPESAEGGTIVFEGQVLRGRFLLSLLDAADATLASTELWPTVEALARELAFPPGKQGLRLVLRNMLPEGSESEVVILRTALESAGPQKTDEDPDASP